MQRASPPHGRLRPEEAPVVILVCHDDLSQSRKQPGIYQEIYTPCHVAPWHNRLPLRCRLMHNFDHY